MRLLLLLLLFCLSMGMEGQHNHTNPDRCHQEQWLEEYETQHTGYTDQIRQSLIDFKNKKISEKRSSAMIIIPVHVILVHPPGQAEGSGSNFSMAHVQSQIDVLNADFGNYNSDAGNTPPIFPSGDTGIQFCLATVDPDGNATDGITRYGTNTSMANNNGRTQVIDATRWPRDDYMNLWSAPNLPFLGLASVPSTFGLPNPSQDFCLVEATSFGGPGFATFAPYNLGRTATHEVGHWLGLFHVWGGGGCGSDDGIDDTPIQSDSNFGCPNHPSPSCNNGGDMFMNYMDYVNDNCMNAFSIDQGSYMNTILSTSRASLQGSAATACAFVVPLTIGVLNQEDPNCFDSNDGFILVEAQGGSEPYSYVLDGETTNSSGLFTDLPAGTYTIEALDNDGNSIDIIVVLDAPLPLESQADITATNECPADTDAEVTLMASGGTSPYFFSINMEGPQSSPVFDDLPNGFYTYQITDNNGCMTDGLFEIEGTTEIDITIDESANVTCSGGDDGAIDLSAEGGNGALSYNIDNQSGQDNGVFDNLTSGEYIIYVTDESGCFDSISVQVTEPTAINTQSNFTNVTCNGDADGTISLSSDGGTGSEYGYSINGVEQMSGEITGLSAGEYLVMTTDSVGCTINDTLSISEPEVLSAEITQLTNVSCFGDSNGSVDIDVSGGTMGYQYILNDDTTDINTINGLPTGSSIITVIDANECSTNIEVEIDLDAVIQSDATPEDVTCNGLDDGMLSIEASNTTGNVMYSINGAAPQADNTFMGLAPGDYTIVISDDTGCDGVVFATITEPTELITEVSVVNNVSCFASDDGEVEFTTTGGIGAYFYEYEGGDGSPQGISAGSYSLSTTDDNGCVHVTNFDITEPTALGLSFEFGDGGSIVISALGGTGPYLYAFDGGDYDNDNTYTPISNEVNVSIEDANGCEYNEVIIISNTNDLTSKWNLSAYPNPALDILTLGLDFNQPLTASIEVFDLEGRTMHKISNKNYQSGENSVKIDVSNFASSIYIVKIASAEGYRYIKVTKM